MNLFLVTTSKRIALLLVLASVDLSAAAVQRKATSTAFAKRSSYSSGPRRSSSTVTRSPRRGLSSTSAFQPSNFQKSSISSTTRSSSSNTTTSNRRNRTTTPHQKDDINLTVAVAVSILLAFNAGFINGACLSGGIAAMKQSISSLTSAYTLAALGMASGETHMITSNPLKLIASYMGGSFLTGIIHPQPLEWKYSSKWTVAALFFTSSILLCIACFFAKDWMSYGNAIRIFMLATATIGIQHSIVASYTSPNFVSSTAHLSGLTSEMGMMLGQMVRGNTTDRTRFQRLFTLVVAFGMGGYISYAVTKKFAEYALLFSAGLNALIGIALLFMRP